MTTVNGSVNYEDSTPIPKQQEYTPSNVRPIARELAKSIRTKMYGSDVRESLARWIEIMLDVQKYINYDETAFKVEMQNQQDTVKDRQTQVEGTMSDVVDQFKAVISNVTKDSEVALARDSLRFGDYTVLDDRLEYIESWLAAHVPAGFHVSLKHNQNKKPKVAVHYYEYAIGTEPYGLGTGPYGLGETSTQTVSCTVDYRDDNTAVINLPLAYALTGIVTYRDGYWYLIDGYKTLRFDLGDGIDDAKATAGNGSNETYTNANGGGYAGDLGLSSYQIAVKNGFNGNVSQWLASLVGPKGDTGTVDNAGLTAAPAFVKLQTQVNNSAVGANLLTDTSDFSSNWRGQSSVSTTTEYNGYPSMVLTSSSQQMAIQNVVEIENSFQYSSSFWAKADNAGDKAHTELFGSVGKADFVLTTNWVRYSATVTSLPDANTNIIHSSCFFGVPDGNKGNVYIALPKLEKGSIATDWCPNPSEILTQSDAAQTTQTKLGITLQSLNSIGDISTMQYRIKNYKTTFWLTKINRDTFDGSKIKPKVRLTSSSVDIGDPKSLLDYTTTNDVMCCINAGTFDVTRGLAVGRVIIDGVIQKDSIPDSHGWTLGIKSDGSLSAYDTTISADTILNDGCESAVTGYVPIIMNGSMVHAPSDQTQPNPRQVICQNASGDYFVFSCDGRKDGEEGLNLDQIGEVLLSFGITFAFNLDGGGSAQTFVKKRRINRLIENRPIPTIIVFE